MGVDGMWVVGWNSRGLLVSLGILDGMPAFVSVENNMTGEEGMDYVGCGRICNSINGESVTRSIGCNCSVPRPNLTDKKKGENTSKWELVVYYFSREEMMWKNGIHTAIFDCTESTQKGTVYR